MADYAPPTGPPPPRVPEGWKAIWNDQYKEWFFVNIYTKQSTWDKPTEPARDPNAPAPPPGPPPSSHHQSEHERSGDDAPPSYNAGSNAPVTAGQDVKKPLGSNNPYQSNTAESDADMARRLQEEENARHNTSRGASDSYYGQTTTGQNYQSNQQGGYPTSPGYSDQQTSSSERQRGSGGGFLNKLKDKMSSSGGSRPMGAPMMGYGAGGYPPPQQQYGGYGHGPQYGGGYQQNPMGYGPPQGYGGYGGQPGYGQPMYAQQQKKKGGLGAGGAAALGVGGGLLGGMLLADAIDDHDEAEYDQGFDDGADMGGGDF